jgi:hypothetical protein
MAEFPLYREDERSERSRNEGGGDGDGKGGKGGNNSKKRPATKPRGQGLRVIMRKSKQHTARHLLDHPFIFQVPPLESFSWSQDYGWEDYTTIEKGTFSRPSAQGLRQISFDTMFVDYDAEFTIVHPVEHWVKRKGKKFSDLPRNPTPPRVDPTKFGRRKVVWRPDPLKLSRELRHIMNSGTPFWLEVHQQHLWGRHDLEMMATLRSLSVEERAGEIDSRYISVSYVEWREPEVKKKKKGSKFPLRHKVRRGDTLKSLSKKYYGGYGGWKSIKKANDKKLKGVGPQEPLQNVKQHGKPVDVITIPDKPGFMKGGKKDDGKDGKGDGGGGGRSFGGGLD